MATRIYLMPQAGDEFGPLRTSPGLYPKYVGNGAIRNWTALTYGREGWVFVAADVTNAEHTAIAANPDVVALPPNLDQQVGGALAATQAALETAKIPADWVTSGMTFRTVLKWSVRIVYIVHCLYGRDGLARTVKFFGAGIGLDSTIGDLPVGVRQRLITVAQRLGLDVSTITLATSLRAAMRIVGQQMGDITVTIGPLVT